MRRNFAVAWVFLAVVAASWGFSLKWVYPLEPNVYDTAGFWEPLYDRMLYGSTAAIANLPGVNSAGGEPDDFLEIVIGSEELCNPEDTSDSSQGVWRCLDAGGNLEWARGTGTDESRSSPAIADFYGDDGLPDIIGGTTSGWNVEAMDRFGNFLWTFPHPPLPVGPYAWHSSPAVGDVVPDLPGLEVVIGCNAGMDPTENHWGVYCLQADPSDGTDDGITFAGWDDYPLPPGGTDGTEWDVIWYYRTDAPVISTPCLVDMNGDGDLDVVFGTGWENGYLGAGYPGGKIVCLNGADGTLLWEYTTGGTYPAVSASPAAADFDGDGDYEIVVGAYDGNVYFIDGDEDGDGTISDDEVAIYNHSGRVYSSAAIGDVDGDGRYEVAIGIGGGYLKIFDYYPEEDRAELDWYVDLGDSIISSPALAGDPDDPTPWPFFRGNIQRTGFYEPTGGVLHIFVAAIKGENAFLYDVLGTGEVVDSARIGQQAFASPVVADLDHDCELDLVITGANQTSEPSTGELLPGPDTIFCFGTGINIHGCETTEFLPHIAEVYTEGCSLVYATVCVYDEDSQYVRGLDISNFGFLENGIPITPPSLEMLNECPPETAKVDVVLLFDFSTSMDDEIDLMHTHVPEFVAALSDVDYRISCLVFNGCPSEPDGICTVVKTHFTGPGACSLDLAGGTDWWATDSTEFACLFNAVMEMYSWPPGSRGSGNEDQFGAMVRANEWLDFRPDAQKVFVLFTDERPIVSSECSPRWGEIPPVWEQYPPDSIINYCREESIIVIPVTPENGEFSYYGIFEPVERIYYTGYYELGDSTGGAWFDLYSEDWGRLVTAIATEIAADSCCYQFVWRETLFCVDTIDLEVNVFDATGAFGVDDTSYRSLCPPQLTLSMPDPCGGITSCAGLGFIYELDNPEDGAIAESSLVVIVNDDTFYADDEEISVSSTGIAFTPSEYWEHYDTVVFWIDHIENENGCESSTPPCTFYVDILPPEVINFTPAEGETLSGGEGAVISAQLYDDFSGVDTSDFSEANVYVMRGSDTVYYDSLVWDDSLWFHLEGVHWLGDGPYTVCVQNVNDSPDYPYCPPNNLALFCWDFWVVSVERMVWFGDTNAHACDTAYIPLYVDSLSGANFYSMDVWFTFNPTVFEPIDLATDDAVAPVADYELTQVNDSLWHIHIHWADTINDQPGGVVAYLQVFVNCNAHGGDFTSVIIDSAQFNDGYPRARWDHGFFFVLWNIRPWLFDINLDRLGDVVKTRTVTIGAAPSATPMFDAEVDIIYPEPPPTEVDAYIFLNDPDHPAIRKLLRSVQGFDLPDVWTIKTDSDTLLYVHWNPAHLPEGKFELNGFLDMKRDTFFWWHLSEYDSLIIRWYFPPLARDDVSLATGWNLISFPYVPVEHTPEQIFPDIAIMLGYDALTRSFYVPEYPEAGLGYWVFSLMDSTYAIAGVPNEGYRRQIYRGWNLIGDINRPVPADSLQTEPPGLLLPGIWLYDPTTRAYYPAGDTLYPGLGFWIFSVGGGYIHLP